MEKACAMCDKKGAQLKKKDNAGKERFFCDKACYDKYKAKNEDEGVCEFC